MIAVISSAAPLRRNLENDVSKASQADPRSIAQAPKHPSRIQWDFQANIVVHCAGYSIFVVCMQASNKGQLELSEDLVGFVILAPDKHSTGPSTLWCVGKLECLDEVAGKGLLVSEVDTQS